MRRLRPGPGVPPTDQDPPPTPASAASARGPVALFLALLVVFGLAFAAVNPPFQAPDELWHTYRAYAVSEGNLFADHHAIPASITAASEPLMRLAFHPERKVRPDQLRELLGLPLRPEQTAEVAYPMATVYPPLVYLPQALAAGLARRLGAGPLGILYAIRLFNLLTFALLGSLALVWMPSHRWLVVGLLVLPMPVYLAASASVDVLTVGLALVWVALLLRQASGASGPLTWRAWAVLVLAAVLCAATKVPYFLLALGILLVPGAKFASRRDRALKVGLLLALVALTVVAVQVPALLENGQVRESGLEMRSAQANLQRLTSDPLWYAAALLRTLRFQADHWARSYVGVLGWLDTPLPWPVYAAGLLTLLVAAQGAVPGWRLTPTRRAGLAALCGLVGLAIVTLIYINHTPVDADLVLGVQGRYFLPLGVLPFLVLASERAGRRLARGQPWLVTGAAVLTLGAAVWALALRFYGG